MKKILVTQRLIQNDSYYEIREALDIQWGKLFMELEFIPIILPYEYDFETYFSNMEIDGILLTGGNDLASINNNVLSLKRDSFEKLLLDYAIKNNIPVFGICRGLQIIADYFSSEFIKVNNQVGIKHKLKVNKESKYFNLLNKLERVNSYHNYSIKNVSNEILISATTEDGIIKAIEHKKYKIFAQMWHSEREIPFGKNELNLIKNFYNK